MSRSLALAGFAVLAVGCNDPVLTQRANSLAPDRGSYAIGPNHRAGFPCTWCHAEGSVAEPSFDLGGTVYSRAGSDEALRGVRVRLFDRHGHEQALESNEAGNFYLGEGDLKLAFPLWVKLEFEGEVTAMQTPIFRERSCATCHLNPAGPASAGRVFVYEGK